MDALSSLLDALHRDPAEHGCWLALADCLEESGQLERAEPLPGPQPGDPGRELERRGLALPVGVPRRGRS